MVLWAVVHDGGKPRMLGSGGPDIRFMRDKGLDPDSGPAMRSDFVRRVGLQLGEMHRKGKLERLGNGSNLRWRLPTA